MIDITPSICKVAGKASVILLVMNKKRPFRTSLKYDKEIKDEVEREERGLLVRSVNKLGTGNITKTVS